MTTKLTPEAVDALSTVIITAVESDFPSNAWFVFKKYKAEDIAGVCQASVLAKMDEGCCAKWNNGDWVELNPETMAARIRELLADESLPFHTEGFWQEDRGYLAQQMRNLLAGHYGDGDSLRDDGILQVLFCGEVVCS